MRIIFTLISLILFLRQFTLAQVHYDKKYLDSVFTEYVNLKEIVINKDDDKAQTVRTKNTKCGLFLVNFVKQNINLLTSEQQRLLKILSGRPSLPKSVISPSGKFRIHYDTTTSEKPKYVSWLSIEENLLLAGAAIDSAYNFEVNYLGYPPPPFDNGMGGDDLYDIYIVNLGGDLYGYTELEGDLGGQKYTSFVVIDNDYASHYSSGINGARVTLAHELHHGIQVGNYILRFEDTFFYEITSTSMEEFVCDDVNDYYAYMPSYFFSPQKAFAENDGYNLAIWDIYLKENFGFSIIKRQWELMPSQRALNAINTSITEAGSSFKHELNNFGVWTFYTKYRAIPGKYFEEASFYPLVRPLFTTTFTSPDVVVFGNSKATANNFIRFTNQTNINDTLFALITNGDVIAGLNPNQLFSFRYSLFDYQEPNSTHIVNNYYFSFESQYQEHFHIAHIFNNALVNVFSETFSLEDFRLFQNYPNPFNPSTKISWQSPVGSWQKLKVYDILGNEVATLVDEYRLAGSYEVEFSILGTRSASYLPSGVFFYQLKVNEYIKTKKMILIK